VNGIHAFLIAEAAKDLGVPFDDHFFGQCVSGFIVRGRFVERGQAAVT
jgi:hypothetical protein